MSQLVGHPAEHREQPLDHHRGQAEAHLVDQQGARAAHDGPADGQHLLLAAGQQPGLAVQALAQLGQQVEDLVVAGARRRPALSRRFSPAVRPANSARPSGTSDSPPRASRYA